MLAQYKSCIQSYPKIDWNVSQIGHFLKTEAFQAQAAQLPGEDLTIVYHKIGRQNSCPIFAQISLFLNLFYLSPSSGNYQRLW